MPLPIFKILLGTSRLSIHYKYDNSSIETHSHHPCDNIFQIRIFTLLFHHMFPGRSPCNISKQAWNTIICQPFFPSKLEVSVGLISRNSSSVESIGVRNFLEDRINSEKFYRALFRIWWIKVYRRWKIVRHLEDRYDKIALAIVTASY